MKTALAFACGVGTQLLVQIAFAQAPDVRFHLDLYASYEYRANNSATFHLYDQLGNASTIQLSVNLEPELRAFVSERLEQFSHDPSHDPLEQYYVEDQGIWRVGKQFVPFGSGTLVRENVLAAEGETKLLIENTKLQVAFCDGGTGNQRGAVARLGSALGVSAALGDRFGISPTSFDLVRSPGNSPGAGRGWRVMLGADATHRLGAFVTAGEFVWLQNGETALDRDQTVWDLSEKYQIDRTHFVLAGFSHSSEGSDSFLRLMGHATYSKAISMEPLIQWKNGRFYDMALTLHLHF